MSVSLCYAYKVALSLPPTLTLVSANLRVVIQLLTLKCGSPLDAVPSRDEMKMAERIVSERIVELQQLEIDEVKKLEVVEEEDQEFQPEEDCAGVTTPLTSEGTIPFERTDRF
ncbi:unnamed protein product [Heligmosomoides polygyrus]|uniref:snRNA-activating protein complex subunit 5 n=1 Tax=Heligmosomoides polygyrus TaxID=6339 RepID=A0A183FNH0_HELPZ|nr:unnamed protein product [Heligmosomoides polygyrus]